MTEEKIPGIEIVGETCAKPLPKKKKGKNPLIEEPTEDEPKPSPKVEKPKEKKRPLTFREEILGEEN